MGTETESRLGYGKMGILNFHLVIHFLGLVKACQAND